MDYTGCMIWFSFTKRKRYIWIICSWIMVSFWFTYSWLTIGSEKLIVCESNYIMKFLCNLFKRIGS